MKLSGFLVLLAACGSSSSSSPLDGAPPADSAGPSHDATALPDAAATGMVAVHVVMAGVPVPGAQLVFSTPSGDVGSMGMTDANGNATGTIIAGGSVTAGIASGTAPNESFQLTTVVDVQPGDNLTLGENIASPTGSAALGNVQISYPAAVTNATSYLTDIGCNTVGGATVGGSVTMPVTSACLAAGGTFDVMSTARDSSGNLLAFTVATGLTPAGDGNTLTQAMPAWRTDFATAGITFSNAVGMQNAVMHGQVSDDPVAFGTLPETTGTVDAGGHVTAQLSWPKSIGTADEWIVELPLGKSVAGTQMKQYFGRASTVTSQTIDASLLPTLTSRTIDVAFGQDTPMLSWTAATPLSTIQGTLGFLSWDLPNLGTVSWTVAVPGDASSVQLPRLSDALALGRVSPTQPFTSAQVMIVQSDLFSNAAAFRASWGDALDPPARNYSIARSLIE